MSQLSNHNEFPARPRPYQGEYFKGYILRLSAANGRHLIRKLGSTIERNILTASLETDRKDYVAFTDYLAPWLRLTGESLRAHFTDNDVPVIDTSRMVMNITHPNPKICTECFKEEGNCYIKHDWMVSHHTHCEKHGTELLDACPCCGIKFDWHACIFIACPNCGLHWEDYCTLPTGIPYYQLLSRTLEPLAKQDYIHKLYSALLSGTRPWDMIYEQLASIPTDAHSLAPYFERAFSLISNKVAFDQWQKARYERLSSSKELSAFTPSQLSLLSHSTMTFVMPHYLQQSQYIPSKDILDANPYFVKQPRTNVDIKEGINHAVTDNYQKYADIFCDQLNPYIASKLLNLPMGTVNGFINQRLLACANDPNNTTRRILMLSAVNDFLCSIKNRTVKIESAEHDKLLVNLHSLEKRLSLFNCDLVTLARIIINYDLTLYGHPDAEGFSLEQLYINRSEVAPLLEKHFMNNLGERISNAKVRSFCFLTKNQYEKFKQVKNINDCKVQSHITFANPTKIQQFFEKNTLINRWAKIHSVKVKAIIRFLNNERNLVLDEELSQYDIFVYENSDCLANALNRFLLYHQGEHLMLADICA